MFVIVRVWIPFEGGSSSSNTFSPVDFGEDELAFQIGETAEILSGGRLCATPHYVQAPSGEEAIDIIRSTFALFLQPDWDEKLKLPAKKNRNDKRLCPNGTSTFGEYSEALLSRFFQDPF